MHSRTRLILLVLLMGYCLWLTGCSDIQDDYEDEYDYESDDVYESDSNSSIAMAQYAGECLEGEQQVAEENVCALPLPCDNPADCEAWGETVAARLVAEYGSFMEQDEPEWEDYEEVEWEEEDEEVLARYWVDGNDLVLDSAGSGSDAAYYEQLWSHFAWIIPAREREMITAFGVYTYADTLAYVVQDEEDWEQWKLAINSEPFASPNEAAGTMIHEFGHLLALQLDEVDPYAEEDDCYTFYWEDGCPNEDAYIYAFYEQFWAGEDAETEREYEVDEFVSEYASTNFIEDMAETWTSFVLSVKPRGSRIVDQKVLFFYEYDELIMLRAELLSRVATWMERN